MNDDKVILELSQEDAERLYDLLRGLIIRREGYSESKDFLHVNALIVLFKNLFDDYVDLKSWLFKMEKLVFAAKVKAIADRTDPMIP